MSCNFSLLKIDGCRLQDVVFNECKLIGVDFFKCEKTFLSIKAINCLLLYSNFSHLPLKQTSFENSSLKECNFIESVLAEANFNSDLSGTIFHGCDLSKANFQEAKNYEINPASNKIRKAKFSLPEAINLLRAFEIEIQ